MEVAVDVIQEVAMEVTQETAMEVAMEVKVAVETVAHEAAIGMITAIQISVVICLMIVDQIQ